MEHVLREMSTWLKRIRYKLFDFAVPNTIVPVWAKEYSTARQIFASQFRNNSPRYCSSVTLLLVLWSERAVPVSITCKRMAT
jgi:hypothetical protein